MTSGDLDMNRKEAIRDYKNAKLPMGLFQVRNTANGKLLIGSSPNLPGMLNRIRYQLEMGGHPNRLLQLEWQTFGAGEFQFEVLDELKHPEEDGYDPAKDLEELLGLWLEKLQPYGERGYHTQSRHK